MTIYEPREDSFLLQKYVKIHTKSNYKVLDMGTGSGIQAITAKEIAKDVTAVDINQEPIKKLTREHPKINAVQSDLFANIKEKYDLITFNPPYLPKESKEPKDSALTTTGGKNGHEIIKNFLKQAKNFLKENGKILLIYSSLSGKIEEIAKEQSYNLKILEKQSFFMEKLMVAEITPQSL
tara:strand:- start:190 stop:729 length:540 start_codon:yes stop_codon:yes gene_type:complete